MIDPDSVEEWKLEQSAFNAANNSRAPKWVKEVVKDLWREVCNRGEAIEAAKKTTT